MKNLMTRLFREEEGQGMVEYAILVALIAVVVAVGVKVLGDNINTKFTELSTKLTDGSLGVKGDS